MQLILNKYNTMCIEGHKNTFHEFLLVMLRIYVCVYLCIS